MWLRLMNRKWMRMDRQYTEYCVRFIMAADLTIYTYE